MEDIKLSSSITIGQYYKLEADKDRTKIADFILERFTERYITPLLSNSVKHGFCTMAISCLMIEALESFWNGWPNTKSKSERAFNSFFLRCLKERSELGVFSEYASEFYYGIRCGILHQAETTHGWRIRRDGALFDRKRKIINATKFHKELHAYLQSYCEKLNILDWNGKVWKNLRTKMKAVIKNCET